MPHRSLPVAQLFSLGGKRTTMKKTDTKSQQNKLPEWLQISLALAFAALLFAACSAVPFVLGHSLGVWFGLFGAVVAIVCWVYLVRPTPGFGTGIIAILGLCALLGLLIAWIIRAYLINAARG